MNKNSRVNTFAMWASALGLVLIYALVQHSDNEAQIEEGQRKADIIKAAKAEFLKRQKWTELETESERLTFPVDSYSHENGR